MTAPDGDASEVANPALTYYSTDSRSEDSDTFAMGGGRGCLCADWTSSRWS